MFHCFLAQRIVEHVFNLFVALNRSSNACSLWEIIPNCLWSGVILVK